MQKIIQIFSVLMLTTAVFSCGGGGGSDPAPVNAKYIDPSQGTNGTGTESSPYNTFAGLTFEAGTSYLIKRGTVLYEQITVDDSGTASAPIIFGAYGTGDDPVIDGSEIITGWIQAGSIYSVTLSPKASDGCGNVIIDGVIQKFVTTPTPGTGEYTIDSSGKVQIYGDPSTKNVRLSRRYFGIKGSGVSYITIKDLHIRQASLHGIQFEALGVDTDLPPDGIFEYYVPASNITVQNCEIEMCGGAYIGTLQAGNGVEFGNSSSICSVTGCTISEIFDSGVTCQTYDNNQAASDFIFSDNTISKCGFAGVEVAVLRNIDKSGSSISGVSVATSTITSCGDGFSGVRYGSEGRGIKINADAGAGDLSGVVVDQCEVSDSEGEGVYIVGLVDTVTVKRTLLDSNTRGGLTFIQVEAGDSKLMLNSSVIRQNGDADHDGVTIYTTEDIGGFEICHNTFYDNVRYGLITNADSAAYTTSILENNLFHTSSFKVHLVAIDDAGFDSVSNNYFTEFGINNVIGYVGPGYSSIATFNAVSGTDEVSGNIGGTDPGLVSASNLDIADTDSPCYHTGATGTGVTVDYSGKNFESTPSIGAYEY